ncbi:MAG: cation-transporting P-type ATPase [Actinomycetota bacterium]|nr:cation-transporting P-type ATPase [Actinomycetota bacterium]
MTTGPVERESRGTERSARSASPAMPTEAPGPPTPTIGGEPSPWSQPADMVLDRLAATPDGLAGPEAQRRAADRPAPSVGERREGFISELVESVGEPLQLLLIAVAVLSAIWGEVTDAVAIAGIIVAVAIVETVTEARTTRAIKALSSLAAPKAAVRRDGLVITIGPEELVTGDVIVLARGDVVPADGRVLSAAGLSVDESALTGEATPALKGPAPVAPEADLAERSSLLHAGTAVIAGRGEAVVIGIGADTEVGRLGELVRAATEPPTPLQANMAELARTALVFALVASVAVPAIGVLRGRPLREMLLGGLVLAFATIPEELPILVTVLLALGGRRLAARGALVRRLRAAETIGSATVVLTDKTGTLTENRQHLVEVVGDRAEVLGVALSASGDADAGGSDPVEASLQATATAEQVVRDPGARLVGDYPFDPARKRMCRVWRRPGGEIVVAAKGAPESILAACAPDAHTLGFSAKVDALTGRGLRVLAFATKTMAAVPATADEAESELRLVGLAAFEDPLRDGVAQSVATLAGAGVRTLVVTGDHAGTASAVAISVGIDGEMLAGGAELGALDDDALVARLRGAAGVARATPEDKLRLVRLLQGRGEVVAVTGDGVNDAPALAQADVGIAMGRRGTDLARDAAGIVLTDDAYPSIAAAVESGRNLRSQLRRAVAFYLGAKVALVAASAVPLVMGRAPLFRPVHIVLLELFMDLGASVAFVSEPPTPGLMTRPPAVPGSRFLERSELGALGVVGVALGAGVLLAALLSPGQAASAAVATWLIGHALVAFSLRARIDLAPRANPAFYAWAGGAALTAVALVATGAGHAFGLSVLEPGTWYHVGAGLVVMAALAALGRRRLNLGERL